MFDDAMRLCSRERRRSNSNHPSLLIEEEALSGDGRAVQWFQSRKTVWVAAAPRVLSALANGPFMFPLQRLCLS
jgi:hypothetical protein